MAPTVSYGLWPSVEINLFRSQDETTRTSGLTVGEWQVCPCECRAGSIHTIESYRMPSQMPSQEKQYDQSNKSWMQLLCFLNPLRGPGILVALVATGVEEVGETL